MQVLKKFSSLLRLQSHTPAYLFADKWKDRDEASEKVYITEAESNPNPYVRDHSQEVTEEGGDRVRSALAEQF